MNDRHYCHTNRIRSSVFFALWCMGSLSPQLMAQDEPLAPSQKAPASPENSIAEELGVKARLARAAGRYLEAATLFEAQFRTIGNSKPDILQGDAVSLLYGARCYTLAGDYKKAQALWQQLLKIPAAPHSSPPNPWGIPFDYRYHARGGIAECLIAEKKWTEALGMYQAGNIIGNVSEGDVITGASEQELALLQGVCLENLGRTDEAVELYWRAAMQLHRSIAPVALRQLVALYATNGQLHVLERNFAREQEGFYQQMRQSSGIVNGVAPDATQQRLLDEEWSRSAMPMLKTVLHFRKAREERRWPVLLAPLKRKPDEARSTIEMGWSDLSTRLRIQANRHESLFALSSIPKDALSVVHKALKADRDNPYLQAAWLSCLPAQTRQKEIMNDAYTWTVQEMMNGMQAHITAPLSFPSPASQKKLPTELPKIYGTD